MLSLPIEIRLHYLDIMDGHSGSRDVKLNPPADYLPESLLLAPDDTRLSGAIRVGGKTDISDNATNHVDTDDRNFDGYRDLAIWEASVPSKELDLMAG